jgi:hypothetical protein
LPRPTFNLLFPGNCVAYIVEFFAIHQLRDLIAASESRNKVRFVFGNTPLEAIRHPRIQCHRLVCHNVDVISAHFSPIIRSCDNYSPPARSGFFASSRIRGTRSE